MQARIPLTEIEAAWPSGIHDLFVAKGVRPEETAAPFDPSNIRFVQPCRYRWDAAGGLVVEQP